MEGSAFDEQEFFRAISSSGVRALLIGRKALVALGLPVLSADYDFWLHAEDVEKFNAAVAHLELIPNSSPAGARQRGRYVLENDEKVDVLIARRVSTVDGREILFDDVWLRRELTRLPGGVTVHLPCLDDLIATKHFAARPKDAEDIRLLEGLRRKPSGGSAP